MSWMSLSEEIEQANHNHRVRELVESEARLRRHAALNDCRPSVVMQPDLHIGVNEITGRTFYVASYGSLLCIGETPELAFQCFDQAWINGSNDD